MFAGEVARAAAAGLLTGVKAVVNGSATAIKSVATLGLDTSQLELIGVTKEDRDRGYDTAVQISTASGQVLIAVGTGGIASALSKGGSVARTASGAIIAFDAAGNAVGVVQGIYDATQNGVSISNGAQIAGGLRSRGERQCSSPRGRGWEAVREADRNWDPSPTSRRRSHRQVRQRFLLDSWQRPRRCACTFSRKRPLDPLA